MIVDDQDRAELGDAAPPDSRTEASQDRAFALGQRSGKRPWCPGSSARTLLGHPEQRWRDGGDSQYLWGDRWRAGRRVGPLLFVSNARSRGRRRCGSPGRRLRRLLEPGCSAAPERHCLALLPSGSDAVRRLPVRGTWLSTLRALAQTPDDSAPRAVLGPAIADCGRREPLAPRLARPGRRMVAHRTVSPTAKCQTLLMTQG